MKSDRMEFVILVTDLGDNATNSEITGIGFNSEFLIWIGIDKDFVCGKKQVLIF